MVHPGISCLQTFSLARLLIHATDEGLCGFVAVGKPCTKCSTAHVGGARFVEILVSVPANLNTSTQTPRICSSVEGQQNTGTIPWLSRWSKTSLRRTSAKPRGFPLRPNRTDVVACAEADPPLFFPFLPSFLLVSFCRLQVLFFFSLKIESSSNKHGPAYYANLCVRTPTSSFELEKGWFSTGQEK